jgi:hypothetical protein
MGLVYGPRAIIDQKNPSTLDIGSDASLYAPSAGILALPTQY